MFFFFKQKTAYEMQRGLVGSEMCIRDSLEEILFHAIFLFLYILLFLKDPFVPQEGLLSQTDLMKVQNRFHLFQIEQNYWQFLEQISDCLLYTSDAADDTPCVALGGRRSTQKKN
eukprot:TRINITY_DN68333_c0_g1_i1.p2 TRINITY_DN68333_c0_g1~~TRINITY_DN68333_c0_g1_i1.p2  ORF type:complete len:115 (-),score=34.88 TRINITY_DN68333_c0_g1_i1:32-376(-)